MMIGVPAMAEEPNLRQTEIGMDIDMTAAKMVMFINDVPVFDPAAPFDVDMNLNTVLPLNQSFTRGRNRVTIALLLDPSDPGGFVSGLTVNFGYWQTDTYPMPFSARPMAGGFSVSVDRTSGTPQEVLTPRVEGQPYMAASRAVRVAGTGVAGTWNTYEIEFDIQMALPPHRWMEGQMLTADRATADGVTAALRKTHAALAAGNAAILGDLGPFVQNHSAAIGVTVDEYIDANFPPFFAPEDGFALMPFDVTGSELQLFGGGRLATMVPIPLVFESDTLDEQGTLFIYYWKDASGQWQVIN
jgi:hypothetical protein